MSCATSCPSGRPVLNKDWRTVVVYQAVSIMVSLTDHLVQLLLCHLLAKGLHYVAELIHRDVAIVILVEDSERGQRSICYLLRPIQKGSTGGLFWFGASNVIWLT